MPTVSAYIPAAALFPELKVSPASLTNLLAGLSRTDVLFWCARLNHVLTATDFPHAERQSFGIRQFLADHKIGLAEFGSEHRDPTVFFRGQQLELIRWAALVCEDHLDDGVTFEDENVRKTFGKAALIAGDLWGQRVYGTALDRADDVVSVRKRAMGPFRRGIEGSLHAPPLAQVLGRGWRLFTEFMASVDSQFGKRFHLATGITIEDYYACGASILTTFMKADAETVWFDSNSIGNATFQPALVQRFVALESQTADELRKALWGQRTLSVILANELPNYDYKPMRERPLLRAADGRTIILDPIFMLDKMAVGPLFHVAKYDGAGRSNGLFEAFGLAFERYAGELLRGSFPKPAPPLFDRLSIDMRGRGRSGREFQIDACLNYITDLFLFEVKAAWVREAELNPEDSDVFLQSLERQFGQFDKRKKGAAQLARACHAITSEDWCLPDVVPERLRRVVPILLVHDSLSSAPGFGDFVSAEFDRAIFHEQFGTSVPSCQNKIRSLSPIVLTTEDIELLATSLEHFGLREVLLDYADAFPNRDTSFNDFVTGSAKYSGQLYANKVLAETAMRPLVLAMERLFGKTWTAR